jgi:hypothetical protein
MQQPTPTAPAWDTQNGASRLLVALALQEVQFRTAISPKSGVFRSAGIDPGTSRFGTRRALLTRLRLDGPGVNGVG